jgi:hypothetical protein
MRTDLVFIIPSVVKICKQAGTAIAHLMSEDGGYDVTRWQNLNFSLGEHNLKDVDT